ncbi:MAG: twin-arginine translocase TatA/TatE family subunit [Candidatus Latescibacteria bacterium]|nr:twin-arginine translocase TatA/TatE family subunit [bacterium]MBD3424050.1 twin-arginine translocase TatA/TatE family subunit [Candidatus Latescibacterota bacterium]
MFFDIPSFCSLPRFLIIGMPGWGELLLVFALILLFFGPKRLPRVAESIGKAIQKFKKASSDIHNEIESSDDEISEDDQKQG